MQTSRQEGILCLNLDENYEITVDGAKRKV